MSNSRETERFWRNRLPHWEINEATYFITIRCHGSIPRQGQNRIREISNSISKIDSNSEQHSQLQRTIFATCEKYLDHGYGFSPFRDNAITGTFLSILKKWAEEAKWKIATYCVMPNHIHLLASKHNEQSLNLKAYVSQLKGRSSRILNMKLARSGAFWQPDWFDRWVRNESEYNKTAAYIQNNPVKAGLVGKQEDYPFSSAEL